MNEQVGPGREYGDAEILRITEQHAKGETIQLRIKLPISGDSVESEWIHNEKLKGGVLIAWCQSVRDQIDARFFAKQREAEEAARKIQHEKTMQEPSGVAGPDKTSQPAQDVAAVLATPQDPDDYIIQSVRAAWLEEAEAKSLLETAQIRLDKATVRVAKWDTIAAQLELTVTLDEEREDVGSTSESEDEDSTDFSGCNGISRSDVMGSGRSDGDRTGGSGPGSETVREQPRDSGADT